MSLSSVLVRYGAIPVLCLCLLARPVRADSEAYVSTLPGSSGSVTATIHVTTILGSDSDTDSDTASATGAGYVVLTPTAPPWDHAAIDTFTIAFGTVDVHFELFCIPFVGCQDLYVTLENLQLEAVLPFEADIAAGAA